MKRRILVALVLLGLLGAAGCAPGAAEERGEEIPFQEGQLYAVAWVGYQEVEDLTPYEKYVDGDALPVHHISNGDYYLVIPRYDGMEVSILVNDIETGESRLWYEDPDGGPFLLQCNESDIFTDATIRLVHQGTAAEFSPFISLENGELDVGELGLNLTENTPD